MALAARCPHCRALFRVVADQLKLRGGLVRCGDCRQVFDAIGSLSYVGDHSQAPGQVEAPVSGFALPGPAASVPATAAARAPAAAPPAAPVPASVRPREPIAAPSPARASAPQRARGAERRRAPDLEDALSVPTLIGRPDPEEAGDRVESAASGSEVRIEPRQAGSQRASSRRAGSRHAGGSNWRDARSEYRALAGDDADGEAPEALGLEESEDDAPSFLLTPGQRRDQRLRRALAAVSAPLAVLAAIQIALVMRDNLLETWPSLRPLLVQVCRPYGCSVGWPAHAELLTIVGSELAAIPGTDVIELNAALRSRAPFVMALPAIEVTLSDDQNRTVARKVFLPADYLASSGEASSRLDEGLGPESDLSIRLTFEARGLNASGFVVYPFYL